jgi:predicted CXXCH cytochrome family protein
MTLMLASALFVYALAMPESGVSGTMVKHFGHMVENDAEPYSCIACHNGLLAKNAHLCTVECGFGGPHSILKTYPPLFQEDNYASVDELREKGIRLFEGEVTCVSCHDLSKTSKYQLSVDNTKSALCFICHRI